MSTASPPIAPGTPGIARPAATPRRPRGPVASRLVVRYSRFVGLMKITLPAIAAALLVLLVFWPRLMPHTDRVPVGFARTDAAKVDTLSIRNPRYFGTDDSNRPFTVTADIATQVDPDNLLVTLEKPVADLTDADGGGLVISARLGFYRQKDDTLDLMDHVDLYRDDGYELHTASARVDIAHGDASGDQPVTGQGGMGTVSGEGFRAKQRGRDVVFTGHSKAVLNVGARKAGS